MECGGPTPPSTGRLDGPPIWLIGRWDGGAEGDASSRVVKGGVEPPHSMSSRRPSNVL
jgi:hypothetical protein